MEGGCFCLTLGLTSPQIVKQRRARTDCSLHLPLGASNLDRRQKERKPLAQDSEQLKRETQREQQPGPSELSQETVSNTSELQQHLVPGTDLCRLRAAACLLPSKPHLDFSCAQS